MLLDKDSEMVFMNGDMCFNPSATAGAILNVTVENTIAVLSSFERVQHVEMQSFRVGSTLTEYG
jgi:hypothetical protein